MTYQQAIADAIKLFLTMDVATTAVTGSGLFSFCHAAEDAVTMAVFLMVADAAITMIVAATTGSGSFSSSSAEVVVTTTVADAANPSMIYPMGSSILNPLVLSDIYPMSTS